MFNCHKFVFKVHSQPVNITTHSSSTTQEIHRADFALETVLKDGLDIMNAHDIPPYAVIHIRGWVRCRHVSENLPMLEKLEVHMHYSTVLVFEAPPKIPTCAYLQNSFCFRV